MAHFESPERGKKEDYAALRKDVARAVQKEIDKMKHAQPNDEGVVTGYSAELAGLNPNELKTEDLEIWRKFKSGGLSAEECERHRALVSQEEQPQNNEMPSRSLFAQYLFNEVFDQEAKKRVRAKLEERRKKQSGAASPPPA